MKTCSKCGRECSLAEYYTRADTGKPRAQCKRCFKNGILVRTYGITIDQYEAMLKSQKGRCAICDLEPKIVWLKSGKVKGLAVDHNHMTGEPRELLCDRCNRGLGNFLDSPKLLNRAADYLLKHRP